MSQIVPGLHGLYRDESLRKQLKKTLPELQIQSAAVKLQCNSGGPHPNPHSNPHRNRNVGGGGCFPCHYDSDAEVDGRRITAIVYANPVWQSSNGGELRLYPVVGPRIDVEPRMGRMVLFSSQSMLHRVLPSSTERWCFTIWLSGRDKKIQQGGAEENRGGLEAVIDIKKRQLLAKYIYAEEWATSLVESHPSSEARDQVVTKHRQDVAMIKEGLLCQELEQLAQVQPHIMQMATASPTRIGARFDPDSVAAAPLQLRWI